MEPTKEMRILFENLQKTLTQMLELDPGNGWHWVVEAQRRVLEMQIQSELKRVG